MTADGKKNAFWHEVTFYKKKGFPTLEQAKQDLEKSIVANLADDIVVGVKGDRIELVITKRFKRDQK